MVSVTVFPQSKMHPAVTAGASVRFLPLGLWTFVSWATAGVQVTPLHPQVLGGAHWVFFFLPACLSMQGSDQDPLCGERGVLATTPPGKWWSRIG